MFARNPCSINSACRNRNTNCQVPKMRPNIVLKPTRFRYTPAVGLAIR